MFQIRVYLVLAGRNLYVRTLCSARGRTSDDSYIYQLSLVVATATVSFTVYSGSGRAAGGQFENHVVLVLRMALPKLLSCA